MKTSYIGIAVLVIIIAGLGLWWYSHPSTPGENTQASEDQEVRFVVASFAGQMKMIPLADPDSAVITQSIDQYYGPYITADLLAQWKAAPTSTPGRLTSSPWPDHIEIYSTYKNADGSYTVQGRVVEVASANTAPGNEANSYPIELKLVYSGGKWKIANVMIGA